MNFARRHVGRIGSQMFWRHSMLWSYRVDLFCIVLCGYVVTVGLLGGGYLYTLMRTIPSLERTLASYADFDHSISHVLQLLKEDKNSTEATKRIEALEPPGLSEEEKARFSKIGLDQSYRRGLEMMIDRLSLLNIELSPDTAKLLAPKLGELIWLRSYAFQKAYVFYFGSIVGHPLSCIIALIPVALMAFFVLNVIYTRDIYLVHKHPKFLLLCFLFVCLIVTPIFVFSFLEYPLTNTYQKIYDAFGSHTALPPFLFRYMELGGFDFASPFAQLESPYSQTIGAVFDSPRPGGLFGLSDNMTILFTTICLITASLWLVRRFGGGAFLGCFTFAAMLTAGISVALKDFQPIHGVLKNISASYEMIGLTLEDPDITLLLIVFFVLFGLFILAGIFTRYWRKYAFCTGYIGIVAVASLLACTSIAVPHANLASLCLLLLICLFLVSGIEMIVRGAMFKFLFEPQA